MPPHQDFIHIQGSPNVWTAWLPLGDCAHDLGGLSLLVGSHKLGVLFFHSHTVHQRLPNLSGDRETDCGNPSIFATNEPQIR